MIDEDHAAACRCEVCLWAARENERIEERRRAMKKPKKKPVERVLIQTKVAPVLYKLVKARAKKLGYSVAGYTRHRLKEAVR